MKPYQFILVLLWISFSKGSFACQTESCHKKGIDLGNRRVTKEFSYSLKDHLPHNALGQASFHSYRLPKWLSVSEKGVLSGTPSQSDLGRYQGWVHYHASNQMGYLYFYGNIEELNHPPQWKTQTIKLKDVCWGSKTCLDLNAIAKEVEDPDRDSLFFVLENIPGWLKSDSQVGQVFCGRPEEFQIQTYNFAVYASDGEYSSKTKISLRVDPCD